MKITVIGTGYVGLVTGAIFSIQGHDVTCVDIDQTKVDGLRRGLIPIFEPDLDDIVERGVSQGRLQFTTDAATAAEDADIVFLAVGTPQDKSGSANLEFLDAAAESIACHLKTGAIVVIKSTVPVGTNRRISDLIKFACGYEVDVVNNPEFLKEGTAVSDCLNPDRIVLGVRDRDVCNKLHELYAPLLASMDQPCPVLMMEPESAEMTKYTANCFLAMKISFINEIANMCEKLGADIEEVRQGICSDRRIGWEFLKPGAGYGGSCFPKDVRALVAQANDVNASCDLLAKVDEVNEQQKQVVPQKLLRHYNGELTGKRIAVWGLAFKPGTDDIREAPAVTLIEQLLEAGAKVVVHDPEAMGNIRGVFGDQILYFENKLDAIWNSDALVLMTDWPEYLHLAPSEFQWRLNPGGPIFDGRNCLNRELFSMANFDFHTIGQAALQSRGYLHQLPAIINTEAQADDCPTFC